MKGMVLGKFMPPHAGHRYLIDFARGFCDELAIVVGSLPSEPIDGALRFEWMNELFPDATVIHVDDDLPQHPDEHPDFWNLWKHALGAALPFSPDFVFAGEDYGEPLAEILDARFIPLGRDVLDISGTAIRADPLRFWHAIPINVQPYFVKRVCVFGPESTGKTTLATQLAEHYGAPLVPEYARQYLERKNGDVVPEDLPLIAKAQAASEDALARQTKGLLICDTNPLATKLWSLALFGACDPTVEPLTDRRYDLYLLTGTDVPFEADSVRYIPQQREAFMTECENVLEKQNVTRLVGDAPTRLTKAIDAIDALLTAP